MRFLSSHPDESLLTAYLADALEPDRRARTASHLSQCDRCQRALRFLTRLRDTAPARSESPPPPSILARALASRAAGERRILPRPLSPNRVRAGDGPAAEWSTDQTISPRSIPMKRIAAVISVTVLPMVAVAQAVIYSASHPDAPGHAIARRIAAPLLESGPPRPAQQPAPSAIAPSPRPNDMPVGRTLEAPPTPAPGGTASTVAAVGMKTDAAATPAPPQPKPDRARIVALLKEHHAAALTGDDAAEYVVVLFDAAGKYLWSTSGRGNVSIRVDGDRRTSTERSGYSREHHVELNGGRFALARDTVAPVGPLVGSDSLIRGRRAIYGVAGRPDLAVRSVDPKQATDSVAKPRYSPAAGQAGRGGWSPSPGAGAADAAPGAYYIGWSVGSATGVNDAPGLQEASPGQSGIQGLPSAAVAAADVYHFRKGEVGTRLWKVMVVHLAPGTAWPRR